MLLRLSIAAQARRTRKRVANERGDLFCGAALFVRARGRLRLPNRAREVRSAILERLEHVAADVATHRVHPRRGLLGVDAPPLFGERGYETDFGDSDEHAVVTAMRSQCSRAVRVDCLERVRLQSGDAAPVSPPRSTRTSRVHERRDRVTSRTTVAGFRDVEAKEVDEGPNGFVGPSELVVAVGTK